MEPIPSKCGTLSVPTLASPWSRSRLYCCAAAPGGAGSVTSRAAASSASAEPEEGDRVRQRAGLIVQRLGRGGGFLDQRAVALGHLVHLGHGIDRKSVV